MHCSVVDRIDRTELPSMMATLCSYESWFGPYHPQTLRLMTEVGVACSMHGEVGPGRGLLERAIRDIGKYLGFDHELRFRALAALRDLFLRQGETENASAIQKEILQCQIQRLGATHPRALEAKAELTAMLLKTIDNVSTREI
jgi:hypothetical protein